ncbi:PadR family transcriptional regulator [Limnochorda pilosa]|nr:PadR family transcriptional regulator [Limnochorda pilosa]
MSIAGDSIHERAPETASPLDRILDRSKLSGSLLLRGLLPYYVLLLLRDGPRYGNQILGAIARETRGRWKPSPGGLYPLLRRLRAAGYIAEEAGEPRGGRLARRYRLTAAGARALEALRDQLKPMLEETIHLLQVHLEQLKRWEEARRGEGGDQGR